jgi:uncharacterized protein (DUF2147 family)
MAKLSIRSWLFSLLLLGLSVFSVAPASAQAIVEGSWRSGNTSEIVIAQCAEGLCGSISKPYVSPEDLARYGDADTAMRSFTDANNKDAALRARPLLGLAILKVKATANPWYFEGEVYNPSDGSTYSGAITVTGADTMQLKGCAFIVLCKEEQWTRVTD